MVKSRHKTLDFDWQEILVTEDDWVNQDPRLMRSMLQQLYLIRAFETKVLELKKNGLVHGPVHTSIGQEAVAVGTMATLRPSDGICGTHRAHHQFLAKAFSFYCRTRYDPAKDDLPEQCQHSVNELLAEIMGLAVGCCGGHGGSMHLYNPKIGVFGTSAIVGGAIPMATGIAFANKFKKTGNLMVCFFGDGAVNQGVFHEALNLAGLWNIPIIYVIENNCYAVATGLEESTAIRELSMRAVSYGFHGRIVDGMNPLAVKIAISKAVQSIRSGSKPFLIEAKTYRQYHHAGDIPGSAFGYRTKDEENLWKARDPANSFRNELVKQRFLNSEHDERLRRYVDNIIQVATDFCTTKSEKGVYVIKPSLVPVAGDLTRGLRSEGGEFRDTSFVEAENLACSNKEMRYVEAIAAVTGRWLQKDPRVLVIGEEVGHMHGGAYQATKALKERFPGRVLDTPISEAGFTGLAGGAAMCGLRPIVEIMFPDFVLVAADQIFNQIGKLRHIYGGRNVDLPLVIRTRIAAGCGYGGQHSMDPTALFGLFPGWWILAPSTPADYIGLFNSAMQSRDPVLIIEHHELYHSDGLVPADNLDYFIKMGKAKKIREGKDITVLAYSHAVFLVMKAAEELVGEGIEAEIIDLRTLSLPDIDFETIGNSFKKTSLMLVVEDAPESSSIGTKIAGECQKRFFDFMDGPILTINGADVPMPVSRTLETAALPDTKSVKDAIRESVSGKV